VRVYALYRAGWILMDRDPKRAFAKLSEALVIDPRGIIAWELRRGVAKAFARFGAPADAYAAFEKSEPDRALDMLDDLANRWNADDTHPDQALATFSELVRRAPDDPRACGWQSAALSIVFKRKNDALYYAHAERLVRIFERARRLRADDDCEAIVREFTVGVSRDPATSKALARQLYDLVLHALPDRRMR
jgi:tetratricopeptide (TPR) repeat protein